MGRPGERHVARRSGGVIRYRIVTHVLCVKSGDYYIVTIRFIMNQVFANRITSHYKGFVVGLTFMDTSDTFLYNNGIIIFFYITMAWDSNLYLVQFITNHNVAITHTLFFLLQDICLGNRRE